MGKLFKAAIVFALITLVVGGGIIYTLYTSHLVRIGDFTINPTVELNPARQYRLVLWEHEIPLPWNASGHREALEQAIEEFQTVYPNVDVDFQMLPWNEGHPSLRESLAQGKPPDVVAMPWGARKMESDLQVPVGRYMSEETLEDYLHSALAAVSENQTVWAWPKWIRPTLWMAHKDMVTDLETVRKDWDFDTFINMVGSGKEKTGEWGFAVNAQDPSLFVAVMTASTASPLFDHTGQRAWTVEDMTEVLLFFQTMVNSGLIDTNIDRMSRSRILQFQNNETLVIAPVNPWLHRHLLTRAQSHHLEDIVAVAPPSSPGIPQAYPATTSVYTVFRQEEYQGDDHTKAAMLLAEHLSKRLGPWEATQLVAVPVHPTAWKHWQDELNLPEEEIEFLIDLASRSLDSPLSDTFAHQQQKAVHQIISEEFPRIWSQNSPQDIAQSIARKIDGVRAEIPTLSNRSSRRN